MESCRFPTGAQSPPSAELQYISGWSNMQKPAGGVKVRIKVQPGRDLVVQLDSQLLSIFSFFCTFTEARSFLVSLPLIRKLTGFVIRGDPAALRGHHQKPNHRHQTD